MHNLTRGSEVILPEVSLPLTTAKLVVQLALSLQLIFKLYTVWYRQISAKVQLLSAAPTNEITVVTKVIPRHGDGTGYPSFDWGGARHDGYWSVFILKPRTFTVIQVEVKLSCGHNAAALTALQSAMVTLDYVSYGPHGRARESQHVALPLSFPSPRIGEWAKMDNGASALPIPTHLLCHADDPVSVVRHYVAPIARPGDILAIAESPLAIMQGRYRHPKGVTPGWLARLLCRLFNPQASLASACGMQALIDIAGRLRVVAAVVGAVMARLFGQRGMFYRLAGSQARLIDDITGTMPPYDQFIVLGPEKPQKVAEDVARRTGIAVAVVDVNDLSKRTGEAVVLGASAGVDTEFVKATLLSNPQGNSDQQTPLVLIRPPESSPLTSVS